MSEKFNFKSKNIIIILKSFELGGAEKQALFLSNYLQNNRACNVYIYSYIKSHNAVLFNQECKKYNLKNLFVVNNPLSASGKFKYLKRRIKIVLFGLKLRKHKPDIIIPYLNPPSIIAALSFKIAGAKITFWHHRGVDFYRNDKLELKAIKKTPFFVANSDSGKEEIINTLNIIPSMVFVLSNFVIPIAKVENLESKLNKELVIGMIGHFRPEKLQINLVKVFKKNTENGNKIKLILAGDRADVQTYKSTRKQIKDYNFKKEVEILNNTTALDILSKLDIGVLLSKKEGMPNVIMEYMAYGLPIVCTNHSGCVALLGKDYPFYIEDNNDIKSISSKLEILIKDKDLRQKIGQANKNRLQKDFLIETYLDKLTSLINTH